MSKLIGVIVDGDGDYASLKKRFTENYLILKTDGPRGHTASVDGIVTRAKKQISMLSAFRCGRVIVVLDFEERTCMYKTFVKNIRQAFNSKNFGIPVNVAIPNKMIENWYLADIENISKQKVFIRNRIKQKNYEGKHGKKEIKKLMSQGHDYKVS